jgi:hypothetical protein
MEEKNGRLGGLEKFRGAYKFQKATKVWLWVRVVKTISLTSSKGHTATGRFQRHETVLVCSRSQRALNFHLIRAKENFQGREVDRHSQKTFIECLWCERYYSLFWFL